MGGQAFGKGVLGVGVLEMKSGWIRSGVIGGTWWQSVFFKK